jgi:peptidoglycan-N-acetylglucosamine deacetylase
MFSFSRRVVRKVVGPAARNLMGTITHVKTTEYITALTFDDGPHPEYTPQLLDILARYDAKATFFMVGEAASKHPELVRRVSMEGHAIGNHSWDHPSFPWIRRSERLEQIRACAEVLAPYGQKLFRPPFGDQTAMSCFDAFRLGYQIIAWNIVASDWMQDDAETMVNRIEGEIQKGSVVLFHDSLHHYLEDQYADRKMTLKAVNILLERFSHCFRFVTIPELIHRGVPQKTLLFKKTDMHYLNQLKGQYSKPRCYAKS